MQSWKGILKIIEIEHIRDSSVLWSQKNIYNQLHKKGEMFLLNCCFNNDGTYPPNNYYFGLDNRSSVLKEDEMEDLLNEPSSNGYNRQSRSSNGGFNIELVSGVYRASTSIMTFNATGGSWGPVRNIFMTNNSNYSGILISSATLSQEIILVDGDSVNLRMALSLS